MSENCKSLVLQDKCNIEIFLSPEGNSDVRLMREMLVGDDKLVVVPELCYLSAMADAF